MRRYIKWGNLSESLRSKRTHGSADTNRQAFVLYSFCHMQAPRHHSHPPPHPSHFPPSPFLPHSHQLGQASLGAMSRGGGGGLRSRGRGITRFNDEIVQPAPELFCLLAAFTLDESEGAPLLWERQLIRHRQSVLAAARGWLAPLGSHRHRARRAGTFEWWCNAFGHFYAPSKWVAILFPTKLFFWFVVGGIQKSMF